MTHLQRHVLLFKATKIDAIVYHPEMGAGRTQVERIPTRRAHGSLRASQLLLICQVLYFLSVKNTYTCLTENNKHMSNSMPRRQFTTNTMIYDAATQPMPRVKQLMKKVPEVTAIFWVIKLLTTAMGESTSDYLVFHINPYVAVITGCAGLIV